MAPNSSVLSSANFKKDPPWNIFCLSVHAPATSVLQVYKHNFPKVYEVFDFTFFAFAL